MRKLVIAAVIVFILGALVAFALMNLGRLVNRNKDYILAQAEQALGRKVAVEDIGVTVWGGIGVRLTNVSLADDRSFSRKDFLRAADLQVNVEFFPLLRKELRVKRMILHQPEITVIRDKKGNFNFASIGPPKREERQQEPQGAGPPATAEALPLLVSLVDVADGDVRYVDRKDGVDLRVSRIDLTVADLGYEGPVSINLTAAVNADRQNLEIQGKIGPLPLSLASSNLTNLTMSGDITLGPVPVAHLRRFAPLAETLPKDLNADGPLSVSAHVDGTLEQFALAGDVDVTASAIHLGDRFRKAKGIPLTLSTDARVTKKEIALRKTTITLHTMKLTATGTITRGRTPVLHLDMDSSRTDMVGWEKLLPVLRGYSLAGGAQVHARVRGKWKKDHIPDINGSLKFTDLRATLPQFPQPFTAQGATVTFTGQRAELPETPLGVGKSQMRLAARIEKFVPMMLTYRLTAPELWVSDFRQGSAATNKPEVLRDVKSDGRASMGQRSLVYQGKIVSARGMLADLDYRNLQAMVSMTNQIATIESFQLQTLNGSLQGQGRYDMRKTPPDFTVTAQARRIDVSEFFRPASGSGATHIRGQANLDLKLNGTGNQWTDFQQTLTGQGQADVQKGALLDVNIAEGALTGLTGVPGISQLISPNIRGKYPAIFTTQNSEFGELKGSLNIREGKVHLDNLLMAASEWVVRGNGWVTLDQRLNLRGQLLLSPQLSADLISSTKVLKFLADRQGRVEIPFTLSGTLPSVTPKPDLEYVARLVQRGLAQQGVEELTKGLLKKKKPSPPPQEPTQEGQASPSQPTPQQEQAPPSAPETAKPQKEQPEEQLLKSLKDLFGR